MQDPEELLQEFDKLTLLEETALKTGEPDGIKLNRSLRLADCECIDESTKGLTEQFYFRNRKGITYAKHSRFTRSDMHRHDFFEMAYAYKGDFVQTINNTRITVKEGSLILLDTNVYHSIDYIDKNTILINILISRDYFINTLLKQLSGNNLITEFIVSSLYKNSLRGKYLHFTLDKESAIRGYINELLLEIKHEEPGSGAVINSFMVILLSRLSREKNCLNSPAGISSTTPATVISILNYIGQNYLTLTLSDAAEYFHFSPNHLSCLLKKYTGKSYMTIVLELKLEKAASLLESTSFSISKIAEISGFTNLHYFYKLFRDNYQCTPKAYRDSRAAPVS